VAHTVEPMLAAVGVLGLVAAAATACPEAAAGEALFPPATFSTNADVDRLSRRWYGRFLRAFGQGSLACPGREADRETGETYRLLWIPSTTRIRKPEVHSLLIVVTHVSAETRITGKTLPWARGPAAGTSASRQLAASEWRALVALFDRVDFWQSERLGPATIDGDQWLFEGRRRGRYQVVARASGRLGAFGDLGAEFLKLAKLALPR
jgi:hypothetical protein